MRYASCMSFRVFTLQQLYYRLLENHPNVKPLAGPGLQLAHVAQAIHATRGRTPTRLPSAFDQDERG